MELVEDAVRIGPYVLNVLRPRNAEALIDEARFEQDDFMPYWAELWPSGLALAEAVVDVDVRGKRTVELGCGLALPSLVAAFGGAAALATDWSPEAVRLAGENAARNGVTLETAHVDWTDPEQLVERGPFDLVLCSDVLYEPRNVDALLDLLPRLGDDILLAEPGRQTAGRFFEAADIGWQISRLRNVSRLRRR
jgi:predicted nicotinamide N-methyase